MYVYIQDFSKKSFKLRKEQEIRTFNRWHKQQQNFRASYSRLNG